MKGVIFDIKRFALHDGPGIRTTVFFKGCPLRCSWCHNPESQGFGVENLAGRDGPVKVGRVISVFEAIREIKRDLIFFRQSGGGVTFSGGEPLSQPEFLISLLDQCGELSIHRTVDTCGYAPRDVLLDAAERTDLFLYDLKLAESDSHRTHTGVEFETIRDNLFALCETDVEIQLRIPVVPGITDTERNLSAARELVQSLPRALPLTFLPYHRTAMDKYIRFGKNPPLPDTEEPSESGLRTVERGILGKA